VVAVCNDKLCSPWSLCATLFCVRGAVAHTAASAPNLLSHSIISLYVPLYAGVVGYLLLSIEEIGVQIEEPFGILPLGETLGHLDTQTCEGLVIDCCMRRSHTDTIQGIADVFSQMCLHTDMLVHITVCSVA
jgi:predicted membrane chloride channel (bestrophin family)